MLLFEYTTSIRYLWMIIFHWYRVTHFSSRFKSY